MRNVTNSSKCDWPKPPKETSSASRPRYMRNAETRDHLAGKRLSSAVLKIELEKLCLVWRQLPRQRNAVFEFLQDVFDLVRNFNRAGDSGKLLKALRRLDRKLKRIQDPYAAVIHHATGHEVDNRSRSKWSRLLRFAEQKKKRVEQVEDFVRRHGGINECASSCRTSSV